MATYTEDLEKRIDQLESIVDRYRSISATLDKIKDLRISFTSVESLISVNGILGYMQKNGKAIKVNKSARCVTVLYQTPLHHISNAYFGNIIHYAKDESEEKNQLVGCLQIFKSLWANHTSSKIQLLTDIIEAEYEYDPYFYGRI